MTHWMTEDTEEGHSLKLNIVRFIDRQIDKNYGQDNWTI